MEFMSAGRNTPAGRKNSPATAVWFSATNSREDRLITPKNGPAQYWSMRCKLLNLQMISEKGIRIALISINQVQRRSAMKRTRYLLTALFFMVALGFAPVVGAQDTPPTDSGKSTVEGKAGDSNFDIRTQGEGKENRPGSGLEGMPGPAGPAGQPGPQGPEGPSGPGAPFAFHSNVFLALRTIGGLSKAAAWAHRLPPCTSRPNPPNGACRATVKWWS